MVNETQGLIALGTFTTIVALIPILMNIFYESSKEKNKEMSCYSLNINTN